MPNTNFTKHIEIWKFLVAGLLVLLEFANVNYITEVGYSFDIYVLFRETMCLVGLCEQLRHPSNTYVPVKQLVEHRNKCLFTIAIFMIMMFLYNPTFVGGFSLCLTTCIVVMSAYVLAHNFPRDRVLDKHFRIGYGAALAYYYNYLIIHLPHKLEERINFFKTYNNVEVEKKLYILCPKSCIIEKYIEDELVERCRELPSHLVDVAGISKRVYNSTVYQVFDEARENYFRVTIEYAQPLRQIFHMRNRNIISEKEMNEERDLFIQTLKEFLDDENKSKNYCEIIEYDDDDELNNLSSVLFHVYNKNDKKSKKFT